MDRSLIRWLGEDFPAHYAAEGEACGFIVPLAVLGSAVGPGLARRTSSDHESAGGETNDDSSKCSSLACGKSERSDSDADSKSNPPFRLPPWLAPPEGERRAAEADEGSGSGFSDVSDAAPGGPGAPSEGSGSGFSDVSSD